jgi:hypothetical protein
MNLNSSKNSSVNQELGSNELFYPIDALKNPGNVHEEKSIWMIQQIS